MKKTILTILICGTIILSVTGCENNKNKFDVGNESDVEITQKEVSLFIKQNTLTKTGATLIIKNNSDIDIQYGEPYEMEIKKDGKWHKINVELDFNLPVYILKSKTAGEIELDWENEYGKLAAGDYRIIKSYDVEKEDGSFESFYVSSEFIIK